MKKAIVIGAGIGGLSTAVYMRALGLDVTVIEAQVHPGGKIRTKPSNLGPVDTGPTVLTLLPVIRDLFAALGRNLNADLDLVQEQLLARHFWRDGSQLDLVGDPEANARAIATFAGPKDADAFLRFRAAAQRLFDAFSAPIMQMPAPSQLHATHAVLRHPRLALDMAPHLSLARLLSGRFGDPRLQQLFGRYATYVGGTPYQSPALLSLIWRAEEMGVWRIRGGMHRLPAALADLLVQNGAELRFNELVRRVQINEAGASTVVTDAGQSLDADVIVFNGDPRALDQGALGSDLMDAVKPAPLEHRSLSAHVLACAAQWSGPKLAHHNLFFTDDPRQEFDPIAERQPPRRATLYLCAQDRSDTSPPPAGPERFEIIENAAPMTAGTTWKEDTTCLTRIRSALASFGAGLSPFPTAQQLSSPQDFARLFPHSLGSLYGQSPHALMATFRRPTAKTRMRGIYLAGGGTHPGAGVPMAALSGRHAAETIAKDLGLTWPFPQTDMRGGTSTGSPIAAPTQSRSSPSSDRSSHPGTDGPGDAIRKTTSA
ncbi:1-hydroxycarotenoid 3,4-desaturase CrtD [Phaeobacter sp.]|uniref:1-hydroxycarotenoid 3,4-desaturase CrtD n=1 Tax=Phaeobacter sp. TaxID=1902409 RepID=UPI0025D4B12D|nr:1-hydroxycarotenoid 3,4-desaturase CrtD [Phaeobacter sp.]